MTIYSKINITFGVLGTISSLIGLMTNMEFSAEGMQKVIGNLLMIIGGIMYIGIVITGLTWLWLEG